MDLFQFAAQMSNVVSPGKKDAAARKELLPPQQKTRPYTDTKDLALPVKPMLMRYKFGEDRGNWIMKFYVQWPIGFIGRKEVTDAQMKAYAQDHLETNSHNKDEKYIDIVRADTEYISYQWNVDKWLKDNFSGSPKFSPPISLVFPIKIPVPRFIYSNSGPTDFANYLVSNFKQYVRKYKNKLYSKNFKFLKVITPDIFDYKVNWARGEIKASIKYTIILGALALYSAYLHKKQFSNQELNYIKTRVSKFGDVSKLDKYLDGIR